MKLFEWYFNAQNKVKNRNKVVGEISLILCKYVPTNYFNNDFQLELDEEMIENLDRSLNNYLTKEEPLAYQVGFELFDDLIIDVNSDVLIPRQESLELIYNLETKIRNEFKKGENITILDACTGSGVLTISLAKRLENDYKLTLKATDISPNALKVAEKNFISHNLIVQTERGDLIEPFKNEKIDILVANPPYIPEEEILEGSVVNYEPHLALFAKENGLINYLKICQLISENQIEPKIIGFEIGDKQASAIEEIQKQYLDTYHFQMKKDLSNRERMIFLTNDKR